MNGGARCPCAHCGKNVTFGFGIGGAIRLLQKKTTAHLTVQPGQTVEDGPDALEHLACRYYRLDPAEKTTRVQVTLEAQAPPATCFLKAALVAVGEDQQPQQTVFLQRAAGSRSGTRLQGEVNFPGPSSHVGLVVANVFVPADRWPTDIRARQTYRIEAHGL